MALYILSTVTWKEDGSSLFLPETTKKTFRNRNISLGRRGKENMKVGDRMSLFFS